MFCNISRIYTYICVIIVYCNILPWWGYMTILICTVLAGVGDINANKSGNNNSFNVL